jgi:hypothetical protein
MKPLTRRDGLLLRELPDELLVYDTKQHRAHCLNRTAATVFCRADGTRTVADLGRLLDPDAPRPAGEAAVLMALERLDEAGLLEGGPPAAGRRLDRRSDSGGGGGDRVHRRERVGRLRWAQR